MSVSGPRVVTVSVVATEPVIPGGTIRVVVEDVSSVDGAATIVAEATHPLTEALGTGDRWTIELVVPRVDDRASYNVRAHLDLTGSGRVSDGDRITTRSYPVLTFGAPERTDVEVVPV